MKAFSKARQGSKKAKAEQQNSRTAEQQNSRPKKIKPSSITLKILAVLLLTSATMYSAKAQINTLTSDTLWSTQGNSVADTNLFIGTITQQDFAIKTASQLQAIIKTDGKFAIGVSNLSQNLTSQFTVFEKGQGTSGNHVVSKFVGKVPGQQNPGMQYSYKIGNNGLVKQNQVKFLGDYDVQFKVGSSNAMSIQSTTGNVGIGTTNPQYKLSVDGTIQSTSLQSTEDHLIYAKSNGSVVLGPALQIDQNPIGQEDDGIPCGGIYTSTFTNWGGNTFGDCDARTIGSKNAKDIYFITNGAKHMTLTASGNLGIGNYPFDTRVVIRAYNEIQDVLKIQNKNTDTKFLVKSTGYTEMAEGKVNGDLNVDGDADFGNDVTIKNDMYVDDFIWGGNGGLINGIFLAEKVAIGDNYPWIGVPPNPGSGNNNGSGSQAPNFVDPFFCNGIDFKLVIDGAVKARRFRANMDCFPDYVFGEDYKLMPLNELEQFVQQNKHLPNIPSEADVIQNGIDLGEMNAKLLEKVEELTLYTIEQEKKLKALEEKLNKVLEIQKN